MAVYNVNGGRVTMIPKIKIDQAARAAYVQITGESVAVTREYIPGVLVDLDAQGRLRGIELLGFEVQATEGTPRFGDPYRSGGAYTTGTAKPGLLGTWQG
jgi:uncharacterized protein YuzE